MNPDGRIYLGRLQPDAVCHTRVRTGALRRDARSVHLAIGEGLWRVSVEIDDPERLISDLRESVEWMEGR